MADRTLRLLPWPGWTVYLYQRTRHGLIPKERTRPVSTSTAWNMHPFGPWYLLVIVPLGVRNPWLLTPFGNSQPLVTRDLWPLVTFGHSCLLGHAQPFSPNRPVYGAIRTNRLTDQRLG